MGLAALLLACPTGLIAQQAPAPPPAAPAQAPVVGPAPAQGQPAADGGAIHLLAGRSQILTTDFDIKSVTLTNPAIADATALSPRELLIDGKAPGTISLFVLGDVRRVHYELIVEPGVTVLSNLASPCSSSAFVSCSPAKTSRLG
jgi:Flp pilus assembly secretin CpaC